MAVAAMALVFQLAQGQSAPVADAAAMRHANGRVPPAVVATRTVRPPDLDGRLDDEAWRSAQPISEFRMVQPNDGGDPTQRTEVRVVYDDGALYVGARLFDTDPAGIVSRVARRDNDGGSEFFTVIIDSYHDHRTSFRFRVNPAGVRSDGLTFNDDAFGDDGWDPVWDAATRIDSLGWVAEIRIPLSQLRFPSRVEQHWGINFTRSIERTNEFVRWAWAPNTEQGFASLFGHLTGLVNLPQPRRLEVLPYTVGSSAHQENPDRRDPFEDGSRQNLSGGLDLKLGVTSNLTLQGTVNPDFGQVEADPAFVNLSAFEQFLQERRPFFVEGSNLFQFGAGSGGFVFGAPQLFYSRRIGRQPQRSYAEPGGYVDQPTSTTILGAAKLSGRVGPWSVGLLEAVTDREEAPFQRADLTRGEAVVEPLTNYGVLSLRRDFRGGASGLGFMATSVIRDLDDPALDFLRSRAASGGVDFFHRFGRNRYAINGSFSASRIDGDTLAILSAQRSSARYYQRPDQDYVAVDSSATRLSGYATSVTAGKVSGNWTWGTDFYAYSPGFEVNDAGFQTQTDRVFHGVRLTRRWTRPGRVFRSFNVNSTFAQSWNFGGTHVGRSAFLGVNGQLRNYWSAGINSNFGFRAMSDKLTRGGPLMRQPSNYAVNAYLNTDFRKPLFLNPYGGYSHTASGYYNWYGGVYVQLRPTSAVTVTTSPSYQFTHQTTFFVSAAADAGATTTFGRRYVFGASDQTTWDFTTRMDWALTPALTVQLYVQPFIANAAYSKFKEFTAPGAFVFTEYGVDGGSTIGYDAASRTYTVDPDGPGARAPFAIANPDFRTRSLTSNLVVRWEWRPGSTLFVVWNRGQSGFDPEPRFRLGDELDRLWHDDQRNTLLVKLSYWMNL